MDGHERFTPEGPEERGVGVGAEGIRPGLAPVLSHPPEQRAGGQADDQYCRNES
jgi:hypothetical protein